MEATREGVAAVGASGIHCTYQHMCYFTFLRRISAVDCPILNIPSAETEFHILLLWYAFLYILNTHSCILSSTLHFSSPLH